MDPHNSPQPIEVEGSVSGWAVLGFLYFFVAIGIIVGAAFYVGDKLVKGLVVVVGFPLLYPILVADRKLIAERKKYHSFFVGTGFAFLLTIVVFFGAMIWGVTR